MKRFLLLLLYLIAISGYGQDGPVCSSFVNRTASDGMGFTHTNGVYTVDSIVYAATYEGALAISTNWGTSFTYRVRSSGLGTDGLWDVYAIGSTVYVATGSGLSISTNGGTNFTTKTTANGLGSNTVYDVYASGTTVYAATGGGLSISTDGGTSFTNKTTANGLGTSGLWGVYASGTKVYAATGGGLSISTNGGTNFTNKTEINGLGSNFVRAVYAVGSTVYAATERGLSISTDGGNTFTNRTTTNGLGNDFVMGVYAIGSTVYAATFGGYGGLSISTNGGTSFTNYTTANGLGSNVVYDVYAADGIIYAATGRGLSMCADAALPVTLTAWAAYPDQGHAHLEWTTNSELKNKGFEVHKSYNAKDFTTIGFVDGANTAHQYEFIDPTWLSQTCYFRLRQIDLDGTSTLSRIIAVVPNNEQLSNTMLYPNPASDVLKVVLPTDNILVQLVDAKGVVLWTEYFLQRRQAEIDVSSLPMGAYTLVLTNDLEKATHKIAIVK